MMLFRIQLSILFNLIHNFFTNIFMLNQIFRLMLNLLYLYWLISVSKTCFPEVFKYQIEFLPSYFFLYVFSLFKYIQKFFFWIKKMHVIQIRCTIYCFFANKYTFLHTIVISKNGLFLWINIYASYFYKCFKVVS